MPVQRDAQREPRARRRLAQQAAGVRRVQVAVAPAEGALAREDLQPKGPPAEPAPHRAQHVPLVLGSAAREAHARGAVEEHVLRPQRRGAAAAAIAAAAALEPLVIEQALDDSAARLGGLGRRERRIGRRDAVHRAWRLEPAVVAQRRLGQNAAARLPQQRGQHTPSLGVLRRAALYAGTLSLCGQHTPVGARQAGPASSSCTRSAHPAAGRSRRCARARAHPSGACRRARRTSEPPRRWWSRRWPPRLQK